MVVYNGACNDNIMTEFLDQLVFDSIQVLDRLGLVLIEKNHDIKLDYFATLNAPQAKILVKRESKKEK